MTMPAGALATPPRGSAWSTVDLAALCANWRWLAATTAPARCGAVVKAMQWRRFRSLLDTLRRFACPLPGSLAHSSGIFLGVSYHFDLARPGAALYGVAPTPRQRQPVQPVVTVQARLVQCSEVARGEGVGYNGTWRARRTTRVASASIGNADGYLRSASNRGRLRLAGVPLQVIGRVSMDTVTVDARRVPPEYLAPGTPVNVIDDVQDINALAMQARTNAYEFLTSLGMRYQRHDITP